MAISSSDISGLPDYTDAQIAKLYKWALVNGAAGQSRTIDGRSVTFPSAEVMMKVIEWAEARDVASDGGGGNIAIVQFGDAT